jgi:hypothetical protein
MPTRRDLLRLAPLSAIVLAGCGSPAYDAATQETWRHAAQPPQQPNDLLRELVRYATLAANSHNTQPWIFSLQPDVIVIEPDLERRTSVVDPDDHHLWVSLGCAAENLVLAAAAFGRRADPMLVEPAQIRIALSPMAPVRSPLFAATPQRQCTRSEFDGQSLPVIELRALESTASGRGVHLLLLTDRNRIDTVTDFVIRGNTAQLRDAAFMKELKRWIRFGDKEALAARDGLAARPSGNPSIPRWLGELIFKFVVTEKSENDKIVKQLRSSAGVAVFVAEQAGPAHWIEVGRAYQRFALLAASLGIRNAFLNQPVEVPALRTQLAQWLGIGSARPDLVVRFGRGPLMPRSLRRPVEAVLGGPASLQA